ncbi:MAG: hypothetical protein AB4063_09665 [Crocosphaera sp.]
MVSIKFEPLLNLKFIECPNINELLNRSLLCDRYKDRNKVSHQF